MVLFDRLVDSQLQLAGKVDVYLVDEIGIIAPWSTKFVSAMNALFDSSRTAVAIIRAVGVDTCGRLKIVQMWRFGR